MKKILSIVLAVIMLLTPASVFAGNFDLLHKTDATKNYTFADFLGNKGGVAFNDVADHLTDYVIEYEGKYYNANEIDAYLQANPGKGLKDAIGSGIADVPKPVPGDLTVIEISAISETQLLVDFSEAVSSALSAANFEVSVGGTAKTVTNVDVQDKSVFVTVSDVKFGDDVQVVVKNVSNADGSKTLASETKTLKVGDAKDLYELHLEADDQGLLADGASTTMIRATLRNKKTKEVKALQGELHFLTTKGQVAQTTVALKDGKATVNLQSEASSVEITAYVTATITSVPGNVYYEGLRSIELPVKFVTNPADIPSAKMVSLRGGEARQADRIFLTMSDEVTDKMLEEIKKDLTAFEVDGQTDVVKDVQATGKVLTLILDVDNKNAPKTPIMEIGNPGKVLKDNVEHIVRIPAGVKDAIMPSTDGTKFVFTDNNFPTLFNVTYEADKRIIRAHFKEAVAEDHAEELEDKVIDGVTYKINRHFLINNRPLLVTGKPVATVKEAQVAKTNGFILASRVYVSTDDKNRGMEEGYIVKDQKDTRQIVSIELDRKSEPVQAPGTYALQVAKVGDWAGLSDPANVIQTQTMSFETTGDTSILDASIEVQSPEQFLIRFTQDVTSTDPVEDVFRLSSDAFPGLKWLKYDTDYEVRTLSDPERVNPNLPTKDYFEMGTKIAKGTPVSGKYFLLELKKDWQVIYNTDATKKNYFMKENNPHALYVKGVEDAAGKKFEKNFVAETPLDATSPKISYANPDKGKVFIVMTEPTKVMTSLMSPSEGDTQSQEQAHGSGVPPLAVEFVHNDTNETIIGTADVLYEDDYAFWVAPEKPLYIGTWKVIVRSLSDDIGNTVETTPYEVEIKKIVVPPSVKAPKIEWIAFDNSDRGDADITHFDRLYVKFSEPMYVGPDANSVGRTENWSINNQPLAKETRIEVGIKGVTSNNDGITINMPVGQWDGVDGKNIDFAMVVNMASNFKSDNGEKLHPPYNGKFEVPLVDTGTAGPTAKVDHDMVFEAIWANPSMFKSVITKSTIKDTDGDGVVDLIDGIETTGGALTDGYKIKLPNGGVYKYATVGAKFELDIVATPAAEVEINTGEKVFPTEMIPYMDVAGKPQGDILNVSVPTDEAKPVVKSALISDDKKKITVVASEPIRKAGPADLTNAEFTFTDGEAKAVDGAFQDVDKIEFKVTGNGENIDDTHTVQLNGTAEDKAGNAANPHTSMITNAKVTVPGITFTPNLAAVVGAAPTEAKAKIAIATIPDKANGKLKIGNKTIGFKLNTADPDMADCDLTVDLSVDNDATKVADRVEGFLETAGGNIVKQGAAISDTNIEVQAAQPGLAGNELEMSYTKADAADLADLKVNAVTIVSDDGSAVRKLGDDVAGTENKQTSTITVGGVKPTKDGRIQVVINYSNNPDLGMKEIFAFSKDEKLEDVAKRLAEFIASHSSKWDVGATWVVEYDETTAPLEIKLVRYQAEVVPVPKQIKTLTVNFY